MRTFYSWSARILAVIFASLFAVSLLLALLLVNAEIKLFEAETYKQAFKAQNLYDRMPKLLAEQIISNLTANPCKDQELLCLSEQSSPLRTCLEQKLGSDTVTRLSTGARVPTPEETSAIGKCTNEFGPIPNPLTPNPPSYLKYLTVQDWEILITTLIPPKDMKTMSEQTLDSFFDFLNGKTDKAVISIGPIKQNLSKNGTEAAQRLLSAQPACTEEELLTFGVELLSGTPETKLCNPPAELLSAILPIAEKGLQTGINGTPDEIPLFEPDVQTGLRIMLGTMRMVMRLSPLLPLVFLMLMTLLAVRTLPGWLKWWGIPLTIAGGLTLAIGLAAGPITQITLTVAAKQNSSVYALRLATIVMDVMTVIARQVAQPVIIEAGIILLIGIGMLIGARLVINREAAKA
jgi:hypothetical protein